jgi:hypothetical protein
MNRKYYMHFNRHLELEGRHAFLSPSNYHWVNYSDDKIDRMYASARAAARGDRRHKLAHDLILERERLPEEEKTLNMYVNDAIGFRMTPEVPLYWSDFFFGTADTLSFRNNKLRVHDLKNGLHPAKVTQLEVYAALFCLEYRFKPFDIEMELRIYQNNEVQIFEADPDIIFHHMEKGVFFSKRLEAIREEELA